ncbi:MAG: hypothetical protein ACUVYA_04265 [Planctomycetota bacterium]
MDDPSRASADPERCYHLGGTLRTELLSHLPFSATSVALGLILAGVVCFVAPRVPEGPPSPPGEPRPHAESPEVDPGFVQLFHLFHPAHMLFSAAATTAMFRRYDRRRLRTIAVGFTGAIFVCGLSDIFFPHVSLTILGSAPATWHICIVDHPSVVLPFAFAGVALGWVAEASMQGATLFSHALHVFISTMASIFYLVGPLGRTAWIDRIGEVFCFTLIAVLIPCCFSDILYPLLLTHPGREAYARAEHAHVHERGRAHES